MLWIFQKSILSSIIASEHSSYLAHGLIARTLRKWSYKKVKAVVTQTDIGKKCFYHDGIFAKKIPNFVTIFENSSQWELSDLPDKPFICLSVARFVEVKQLDHFIEIARIVKKKKAEVFFYLVGSGPLEHSLRHLIKKYKLETVFFIFPATAHINYFYSIASAYIVTSSSEAFPMTIIEALSFSLPVLSYDQLDGPKEIITNNHNGFLCKQNSPSCVAHKIIDLVQSSETLKLLKSNALDSSRKYHHQVLINDWVEILK
jgi:glycosyltransferase involved in cell wall biosynthesis